MGLAKWRGHMAAPDVSLLYMHSSSKTTSTATRESLPSGRHQTTASHVPWWIIGRLFWKDRSYFQATPLCYIQQLYRQEPLVYRCWILGTRLLNSRQLVYSAGRPGFKKHLPSSRSFVAATGLTCLCKIAGSKLDSIQKKDQQCCFNTNLSLIFIPSQHTNKRNSH